MATVFDSIRPVQMPDPMEQQGRLYNLMALQDRADTSQLQREQLRRSMAKEGRLAQIMGQVNGDAELAAPLLFKEGMFNEANTILKSKREADESGAKLSKTRAEAGLQNLELVGRVLGTVVDNPTPQSAEEAVRYIKSLNPNAPVQLPTDGDFKGWAQRGIEAMLTAKDRMGRYGAPVQAVQNGAPVFVQPNQMGGAPRVMEGVTPPETDEFAKALRAAGIDPASPQGRQLAMKYLEKKTSHPPANTVSVSMEKGLGGEIAKVVGENVGTALSAVPSAQQTISQVQTMVDALRSGKVNVGPGADVRQVLDRIGVTLGVAGKDAADRLQNTTSLMRSLARQELQAAGQMKGQGQITENERKLLKAAESGTTEFSVPELMELARSLDSVARKRIAYAKQVSSQVLSNPEFRAVAPFIGDIQEPKAIDFNALSPAAQTQQWQNRPPLEAFQR